MPHVTETEKVEWFDKPSPRDGLIRIKPLAKGTPGAPDNFEFNLYHFGPGYFTPRHRHNFEQMRFALSGELTYDPKKPIRPGSLVYFPEGAYYGPQDNPVDSLILLLQYGGASGQGYLSQQQLIAARAEMSKTGNFHEGIYTWYDAGGKKHNMDGVEAIYEHVFKQPVRYVKPRIPESVCMDATAYEWIARGDGIDEKLLGVFTERRASAAMLRATRGAQLKMPTAERQLLFTLEGGFRLGERECGKHTSVFCDRGEACTLDLLPGCEAIVYTLPRWATT